MSEEEKGVNGNEGAAAAGEGGAAHATEALRPESPRPDSLRPDSPRAHLWGDSPKDSALARFLDDIYGVLFSPRATFEDLAARPPLGIALALYALILAVGGLASLPALEQGLSNAGLGGMLRSIAGFLTPIYLVATIASWIIGAAVLHLLSEWLGGHGRASDFFTLGAFYRIPELFLAPLTLLTALVWRGLSTPITLAIELWVLVLQIMALRANYRFGTGRAILVLVLPLLFTFAVVVALVISAVLLAAPFLPSGLKGF